MRIEAMDVIKACSARLRQRGTQLPFSSLATDSRKIQKGALFFALSGPHHDGHHFVSQALKRGASGAIIQKGRRPQLMSGRWVFAVDDVLRALGDVSAWWRGRFSLPVIGVTGSNGKTTTKELIAQMLATRYRILKTEGNYNNRIGVPLTLQRLSRHHQMAVLEMGMNVPGEIERLVEITRPEVGVITNIARAHLEGMGSIDAIAHTKGALIRGLPASGLAVVNADDPRTLKLARKTRAQVITYGLSADADVRATRFKVNEKFGTTFEVRLGGARFTLSLPLPGPHNARNVLAALAVADHFQIPLSRMKQALQKIQLPPGRMQCIALRGGGLLINDSYNANPESVSQALQTLAQFPKCRKIVVLGDMLELGSYSRRAHRAIGREAAAQGAHQLIAVGEWSQDILAGALKLPASRKHRFSDATTAAAHISEIIQPRDVVLIKGSRGIQLERIIPYLKNAGRM